MPELDFISWYSCLDSQSHRGSPVGPVEGSVLKLSFSLAWWMPPNKSLPQPSSSSVRVLNNSPTASSCSGINLAYADTSQTHFPFRVFSFCGTCWLWILLAHTSPGSFLFFFSTCQAFAACGLKCCPDNKHHLLEMTSSIIRR